MRAFAVHEVMEKLGAGCTEEKVVKMASAIEDYMLKDICIPDTIDPEKTISDIVQVIGELIANNIPQDTHQEKQETEE